MYFSHFLSSAASATFPGSWVALPCRKGQKCSDRWHPRPSDSQTSMGPVSHHQVSSHLTSKGQLVLCVIMIVNKKLDSVT